MAAIMSCVIVEVPRFRSLKCCNCSSLQDMYEAVCLFPKQHVNTGPDSFLQQCGIFNVSWFRIMPRHSPKHNPKPTHHQLVGGRWLRRGSAVESLIALSGHLRFGFNKATNSKHVARGLFRGICSRPEVASMAMCPLVRLLLQINVEGVLLGKGFFSK